jgi:hypothetical protein
VAPPVHSAAAADAPARPATRAKEDVVLIRLTLLTALLSKLLEGRAHSERDGGDGRAADWFFRQREVVVLGGTLRWTDELRSAPPLTLTDLQFVVRNSATRHALRLDATPPIEWGERVSLRGVFRQSLLSQHPGRWQDWKGPLFADFTGVDLSRLRQYADLGVQVRSGQGALRA